MGRTKQAWIAETEGHQFTMYAVMRAMGLPLTEEQERFQAYLERTYPAVVYGGYANDDDDDCTLFSPGDP